MVRCYRTRFETVPQTQQDTSNATDNNSAAQMPNKSFTGLRESALEYDTIPEKNMKGRAISHQAKYDSVTPSILTSLLKFSRLVVAKEVPLRPSAAGSERRRMIYLDGTPFATFYFKYRSRSTSQ